MLGIILMETRSILRGELVNGIWIIWNLLCVGNVNTNNVRTDIHIDLSKEMYTDELVYQTVNALGDRKVCYIRNDIHTKNFLYEIFQKLYHLDYSIAKTIIDNF